MIFTEQLDLKGIEWHVGSKEGEIVICCPFCHLNNETEDTRFRLGINLISKKAHCFNCEWSSKENTITKVLEGLDIEAEESDDKPGKQKKKEFDGKLPESFELLWPLKRDIDFLKAYKYLRQRRVTDKQIQKHHIGFCLAGKYSNRIIFPILIKDELKCFIGRDFTDKQYLRYKNSEGKKWIYGVRKHPRRRALLVEGAFDKLSAERVYESSDVDVIGIPGRVLQDTDIELLKCYEEIIRIPDDDKPGLQGALKDAKKLKDAELNVYIAFLNTKYKDINSAFVVDDIYAIRCLARDRKRFTYSMEINIRTMLATEYRGAKELHE